MVSDKGNISTAREIITADSSSTNSLFLVMGSDKPRARSFKQEMSKKFRFSDESCNGEQLQQHQFSIPVDVTKTGERSWRKL